MRVIDYHMHTHFSGDSEANPREHVLKAIEMNLDEICFTDHRDFDHRPYFLVPFQIHRPTRRDGRTALPGRWPHPPGRRGWRRSWSAAGPHRRRAPRCGHAASPPAARSRAPAARSATPWATPGATRWPARARACRHPWPSRRPTTGPGCAARSWPPCRWS